MSETLFDFGISNAEKTLKGLGSIVQGIKKLLTAAESTRKVGSIPQKILPEADTRRAQQSLSKLSQDTKNFAAEIAKLPKESPLAKAYAKEQEAIKNLLELQKELGDEAESQALEEAQAAVKSAKAARVREQITKREYDLLKKGPEGYKQLQAKANAEVLVLQKRLAKAREEWKKAGVEGADSFETLANKVDDIEQSLASAEAKAKSVGQTFLSSQSGNKGIFGRAALGGATLAAGGDYEDKLVGKLKGAKNAVDTYERMIEDFTTSIGVDLKQVFGEEGIGFISKTLQDVADQSEIYINFLQNNAQAINKAAGLLGKVAKPIGGLLASAPLVGPLLTKAAVGIGSLIPPSLGLSGALGPLLLIAVPLAAAFAGLSFLFQRAADDAEKLREAAEKAINAEQERRIKALDNQKLLNRALIGDESAIQEMLNRYAENQEAVEKQFIAIDAARQKADAGIEGAKEEWLSLSQELQGIIGDTQTLESNFQQLGISSNELNQRLFETIQYGAEYANTVKDAGESLYYTMEDVKQATEDLESVRTEAGEAMLNHEKEISDWLAQEEFSRGRELEDLRRSEAKAAIAHAEQLADMETEFRDSELEAAEEHGKALTDMQVDFIEQEAQALEDLQEQLADMDENFQKDRAKTIEDYQKQQVKDTEQHLKEIAKSEKDFDEERIRRMQDLHDQLFELELNNDVLGYIQAQRNAEKEEQRIQEDFDKQQSESEASFREQQDEARKQHEEGLEESRKQYEEQKAEAQIAYEEQRIERQEQYAEQKADAIAAYEEQRLLAQEQHQKQLLETQEAYDKQRAEEAEERAYQEKRRQEDLQRTLDQMEAGYQKELEALKEREREALYIIDHEGQLKIKKTNEWATKAVGEIERVYAQSVAKMKAMNYANTGDTDKTRRINSGSGSFGSSSKNRGFGSATLAAEGGIFNKPTLVVAGEEGAEAILPLNRSRLPQNFGGPSLSLRIDNLTLGSDVSRSEIERQITLMGQIIIEKFSAGIG